MQPLFGSNFLIPRPFFRHCDFSPIRPCFHREGSHHLLSTYCVLGTLLNPLHPVMGVINTLLQERSSHFPKVTAGDFRGDGTGNLGEDITEGVLVFLKEYHLVLFPLSILLLPGLNTSVYFIFLGGL